MSEKLVFESFGDFKKRVNAENEKLVSDLKEANWYHDHYLKNINENEFKLRAMALLIRDLETKIAKASNPEEIVNE
jgi:hypothetical protein